MARWRSLFEAGLPPPERREFGEQYQLGPPATPEQIAEAERALEARLPDDVRELLSEFNGIWYTTTADRRHGYEPSILYLDTEHLAVTVPGYLRTSHDPLPPSEDLRKVVFVCQVNGFADLYGVCLADVAGHRAGEVVKLDHELGVLEACSPSLAEFVRKGPADD